MIQTPTVRPRDNSSRKGTVKARDHFLLRWSEREHPTHSGSGVIPAPVREREFRPLRYDMMSHARLAMIGRR